MPSAYHFSFVDFDSHVRANSPAEGACRAFTGIFADDEVIALLIEIRGHADDLFGTGDKTELASLASFFINSDFSHWIFLKS
jgi:hypothetical protein